MYAPYFRFVLGIWLGTEISRFKGLGGLEFVHDAGRLHHP